MVKLRGLVRKSNGPVKSFHAHRKVNTVTVASTGTERGKTSCLKICHSEAPSTRAASHISSGMVRKNCRNRKTSYAFAKKPGTISGRNVSPQYRKVLNNT